MPEVDFMIIGDYVRADPSSGLHVIAGGIDTITTPVLPAAQNVGVGMRLLWMPSECDHEHSIELRFQTEDGVILSQVIGQFVPTSRDGLRPGTKPGSVLAFNIGLPLLQVGGHSMELLIDDVPVKGIPLMIRLLDESAQHA